MVRHHPDQINLESVLTALPDKNGMFLEKKESKKKPKIQH